MKVVQNTIIAMKKELSEEINHNYEKLYDVDNHELKCVLSTLHNKLICNFENLNRYLPTVYEEKYFHASASRKIIEIIEQIRRFRDKLVDTQYEFFIDEYYDKIFELCDSFLKEYRGSTIPKNTNKINLYYSVPIFIPKKEKANVNVLETKLIDYKYIAGLAFVAKEDLQNGNYDSVITKSRTMIEEAFCFAIEAKGVSPKGDGNIVSLYKLFKTQYNMHTDPNTDERIKKLLGGLATAIQAISDMRNNNSDSHGTGSKRYRLDRYHTEFCLNSAVSIANFILCIAEKNKV